MDSDHLLVLGACIFGLGIPALVSAWSDERRPWAAGFAFVVGLGLSVLAWVYSPEGYRIGGLPHVFYGVMGDVLH